MVDGRAGNAKNLPKREPGQSPALSRQKKRDAQSRLLTLLTQGSTVKAALEVVGRSASTMQQWREHDPDFARRVDILRHRTAEDEPAPFADFRLAYFGFETYWHHKLIVDAIEQAKPQSITLVLVPPEWGKGVCYTRALIPTPAGQTKIADLQVDDEVFGRDGRPTKVLGIYPQGIKPFRRLTFSDGVTADVSLDHLWLTRQRNRDYKESVVTTEQIEATLQTGEGRPNHAVPVCEALQLPEVRLPVDPWVFGYWLGNGAQRSGVISTHQDDLEYVNGRFAEFFPTRARVISRGPSAAGSVSVRNIFPVLRALMWPGDVGKYIPMEYQRASEAQRRQLLAGLMDSDGFAAGNGGQVELCFTNERLARDAHSLILGLGMKCSFKASEAGYKVDGVKKITGTRYRMRWVPDRQIFDSPRKQAMWEQSPLQGDRQRWRTIMKIEDIGSEDCVCIRVAADDSLFLMDDYVVTHNSTLLEDYCCYKLGPVDPNHRICVISESTTQSRKMVRRVENRMTDEAQFSEFIRQHGPFKASDDQMNRPWNADFFTVLRRTGDERDPSMEARGAGSKLYGSRYDLVLLDDIQSVQTLSSTDSLLDFFRSDLLTRPGIEGRIIIVGTRIGPGDFYERILEEDLVDEFIKVPALDGELRSNFPKRKAPNGKLVGWDEDDLAIRRQKVGEEIWARVYMQEPQSKVGQTFSEAIVEDCFDHRRGIGFHHSLDHADGIIASVDPGLGAGYCSMKVGAMAAQRLSIIDSFNKTGLGRYEDIFDQMEIFSRKYNPAWWVVETNAMQKGLARDDRLKALSATYGFRIVEHNCVDAATQILTKRGWLFNHDLRVGDEILTLNIETELSEWLPVEDIYRGFHHGDMARFDSRTLDALVTWNHKWPRSDQNHTPMTLRETDKLGTGSVIPMGRPLTPVGDPEPIYSDDLVELVGWAVTEGSYRSIGSGIMISQSSTVNPQHCDSIRSCLKRMGAHFNERGNHPYEGVLIFEVSGMVAQAVRGITDNGKHLPAEFVTGLPSRQRKILLDTLISADGWITRGKRSYCSNDDTLADAFSILCALEGRSTNRRLRSDMPHHWAVSERRSTDAYLMNVSLRPTNEHYRGTVWCPSTRNGTFYARRGGKTYFTGNTSFNKTDLQIGVASMAGGFMRREISLPYGDEAARKLMATLVKQLYKWRPDVPTRYLIQDEVMSLWFAWKQWNVMKRSLNVDTGGWNRAPMPLIPTSPRIGLGQVRPTTSAYT